jgi:hypothetical protein
MPGDLYRDSQTEQGCKNVVRHQYRNCSGVAEVESGTGFLNVLEQNDRYSAKYIKSTSTFLPATGHSANVVDLLHPEVPLPLQTFEIRVLSGNLPLCFRVDSSIGIASLRGQLNAPASFDQTLQQSDNTGGVAECLRWKKCGKVL